MIDDLIGRAADAGFMFELTDGSGARLVRIRRGAEMPPELLAELKANRDAILERLECASDPEVQACRVCGRDISDPEDRDVIATNHLLCDRGGSKGHTDIEGFEHQPSERCPLKSDGRAA